jgi:Protein of unknown function (DUF2950)
MAEEGDNSMTIKFCIIYAAIAFAGAAPSLAQERFDSPEAAAQAVIDAATNKDSDRLWAILGPQGKGVLSSGNAVQDSAEQAEFATLARTKHRLEICPLDANRIILSIGEADWPFPVPIVRTNGKWSFDTAQTAVEMRARKIGADEIDVVEICKGYVEAQQKYAAEDRDKDGMLKYAPRLTSTPGQHDGLYWDGTSEPLVPAGLAQAAWDGQKTGAKPYHGYYFRILQEQGSNAPGGAHVYTVGGKMIGGFALVAWPAEYGVTGIHTFIVNHNGAVYEKDIEPAGGKTPAPVTRFDPDDSWMRVE